MIFHAATVVAAGLIVSSLLILLFCLYGPSNKVPVSEVLPVVYWDSREYAKGVALKAAEGWEVSAVALSPGQYGNAIFAVVYKRVKRS